MIRRPALSLVVGLAGLAAAGWVAAQTAPSPQPTESAPVVGPVPAEEAPPAVVPTPAPVPTPSVQPSEVAPAATPKAQVAAKPTESTTKRARYDVAIIQALDKVTAETVRFEAAVGQPVR